MQAPSVGGHDRPRWEVLRAGDATLRRGHAGGSVREIQTSLNRRGAKLAVDGLFGPKTEAAVRSFQRRAELPPNGQVGAPTLGQLEQRRAAPAADVAPAAGLESWRGAPVNRNMVNRVRDPEIAGEIERAARARGIDPRVAKAIAGIESGGNPSAKTGSYKGLFQLSDAEFAKYGNGGNIFDPRANAEAGMRSMSSKAAAFEQKYGRPPTPTELYLAHQQGEGGLAKHLARPDGSAVQNMLSTGEGQRKGLNWARAAIWGNVPTDMRGQFPGGVDSITSRRFAAIWASKLQGVPFAQGAAGTQRHFGAFGPASQLE